MTCKIIPSPLTIECDNGEVVASVLIFKDAANDRASYENQLKFACRSMHKEYSEIQFCEDNDKIAYCAVLKK